MPQLDQQPSAIYFQGVTSRILPLPANMFSLRQVCNTYLNEVSEEVSFEPLAPYVLLTILTYDRMADQAAAGSEFGWSSQNEIYFNIPLACHRKGYPTQLATSSPFIFVNNPLSLIDGRDVFGWPKQPASLESLVPSWVGDPTANERLMTVQVDSFKTPFRDQAPALIPLVTVERIPPYSLGRDLWQMPLEVTNPVRGIQTLWRQSLQMGPWATVWESLLHSAALGMSSLYELIQLWCGGSSREFLAANLKQVRSLERPDRAAYQSITLSPMKIVNMDQAGIDGALRIWSGDPSGGYRVLINRNELFPIVETLGLKVSNAGQSDNGAVSVVVPLFPYWLQCDLSYGNDTREYTAPMPRTGHSRPARFNPGWDEKGVPTPPFTYPALSARAIALQVDVPLMAERIRSWDMPVELGTLELRGNDVTLLVASAGVPAPMYGSAGWWWKHLLALYVPVRWHRPHAESVDVLVNRLTFTDSSLASIAANDLGSTVSSAKFVAPPDIWLDSPDPDSPQKLLRLSTWNLPALDIGAELTDLPLIDISRHTSNLENTAGAVVLSEATDQSLNVPVLSFRQVPSAQDASRSVYQEWFVQNFLMKAASGHGGKVIIQRGPVKVAIYRYPSLDLVKMFALCTKGPLKPREELEASSQGTTISLTLHNIGSLAVKYGEQPWAFPDIPGHKPAGRERR